jgi:hypothetical protein
VFAVTIAVAPSFKHDPVGFVMFCFPWGKVGTPLEKFKAPRKWQLVELIKIRDFIRANRDADKNGDELTVLYMAICSGQDYICRKVYGRTIPALDSYFSR